jgi:hypothetical protein
VPLHYEPQSRASYLQLDPNSPWHISAIKATAMESLTLPTRLRQNESGQTSLGNMEEILNSGGQRRIAQLEMDLADPAALEDEASGLVNGVGDARMLNGVSYDEDDDEEINRFAINFLPPNPNPTGDRVGRRHRRRDRILARVEALRGGWKQPETGQQERRNPFGGPIVER